MLVVHTTNKLLDRVGRPSVELTTRSTTVLGSWYATVLFWRSEIALLVNERTLLPVRSDEDPVDFALELAQVPTSPLYKRHMSPDREFAAVVAEAL